MTEEGLRNTAYVNPYLDEESQYMGPSGKQDMKVEAAKYILYVSSLS